MDATDPPLNSLPTTAARWAAVERRDASADGKFLFAVRTTGVYCRPSCPSRRARRENVLFFASAAAAEIAGFRACRRCAPQRAASDEALVAAIADACRRLDAAAADGKRVGLAELARAAGYSPAHFHRAFRRGTGLTPREYGEAARYRQLRAALESEGRVIDAIESAGFSSPSRAYAMAKRQLGTTPAVFREAVRSSEVRYALRATALGWVLLAATEVGVCAIALGGSKSALEDDIRARHPHARLAAGDRMLAGHLRRVVEYIARPATRLKLPLDVAGTAFQHRVWRALVALPPGTTTSYGDLAAAIGAPSAVRAVAGACAANPVALAIPCHRVIAKDGGLAGYRWGVERKALLQERERAAKSARGGNYAQGDATDRDVTVKAHLDGVDLGRLATLAALWGASFIFMRVLAPALGPVFTAMSRVLVAGIVLVVYGRLVGFDAGMSRHWRRYALIGIVGSAIPFVLFSYAALRLPASYMAILNAATPYFTLLLSARFLDERLSWQKVAGLILGSAGVALVSGAGPVVVDIDFLLAAAACLGATFCYAANAVYIRKRASDLAPRAIAGWSQICAGLALLPAVLLAPLPPATAFTPAILANIAGLAMFCSALAYLLYYRLIADVGPARAMTVTFLIPLFGILWGRLILDETLTWPMLAGCALVLAGTAFVLHTSRGAKKLQ